jgi:hypothetical protein
VQRLEDAQIPVEFVSRCTVTDRPPGADPERTRADAIDDAIRVAKEIDQVLDQIGIVELNRCHLPQRAPELPQRGRYLTVVGFRCKSRARFVTAEGVEPTPLSRKEICVYPRAQHTGSANARTAPGRARNDARARAGNSTGAAYDA